MIDGAYDEEFTPEEEEIIRNSGKGEEAPPTDAETPPAPLAEEAAPAGEDGKKAVAPPVEAKEPAAAAPTDDDDFAAWQKQHEGKTPEELARLAYQQTKRANKASFEGRQNHERLAEVAKRAQEAADRARATAEERRKTLDQRLKDDPDTLTKELVERRLSEEEELADVAAHNARVDAAEAMAAAAIPDYSERKPAIYNFGREMNFTDEELNDLSDGRSIATLYLASITGKLLQAGIIDLRGNFLKPIGAVREEPQDPRLKGGEALQTLSSAPARASGGASSIEEQLQNFLNMSDEELSKIPPAELDAILRQAA